MTKPRTSMEEEGMQPLPTGLLVYQCELCNQWYSSVSEIMTHRSQHHSFNYTRPVSKVTKKTLSRRTYLLNIQCLFIFHQVMDKPTWEGFTPIENY